MHGQLQINRADTIGLSVMCVVGYEEKMHPEQGKKMTTERKTALKAYLILVGIWTLGGFLVWTGSIKPLVNTLGSTLRLLIIGPFGFLTWPAHEMALFLSGHGLGANASAPVNIQSFIMSLIWSGILWAPLIGLRWRRIPIWLAIFSQIVVCLITFGLFWKFGNG